MTETASYKDLFLGNTGGCLGETCALALLIGGIYLIVRKIISPVTPIAFIGTVALLNLIAGNDVLYQVLAGGLILGSYPEGVSFSILLMNIVTPYIDRFTMTKPIGAVKEAKEK